MHGRVSFLLALLAAAAFPAAAPATITVGVSGDAVVLTDPDGDDNGFLVEAFEDAVDGPLVTVHDTRAVDAMATPIAPCTLRRPRVVQCPATGVETLRVFMGAGDDDLSVHGWLRFEVHGEEGDDELEGSPRDDVLDGGAGSDRVVGRLGADVLRGGEGNDLVDARVGEEKEPVLDPVVDCGAGDDSVRLHGLVETAAGCEVAAPEMTAAPRITGDPWTYGTVRVETALLGGPFDVSVEWQHCEQTCDTVGTRSELFLDPWFAGRKIRARVQASNRAGESLGWSAFSAPIGVGTAPVVPSLPHRLPAPVRRPAPEAREAPAALLARARSDLTAQVGPLATGLAKRDPRRVGAALAHTVVPPSRGQLGVRWTVSAAVARRHGLRVAGSAPITVARAAARRVGGGFRARMIVTPTKEGRRLLARASRVPLTLRLRFVPAAVKQAVEVSAPFTLRRR